MYPFVADGLVRADILTLLEQTTGLPSYYSWRSRSGCYFCFFQRKREWLGLREHHPDLFEKAKRYEAQTFDPATGRTYTWMDKMSLQELDDDARENGYQSNVIASDRDISWQTELLSENLTDDSPYDHACAICSL